jgi:hypothetical protein
MTAVGVALPLATLIGLPLDNGAELLDRLFGEHLAALAEAGLVNLET